MTLTPIQQRVLRQIGVIETERAIPESPLRPTRHVIHKLAQRYRRAMRPDPKPRRPDHAALHLSAMVDEQTTPELVVEWAAKMYGVSVASVRSGDRSQRPKWARWAASYVLRHKLGMSYPAIAKVVGSTAHTTVMAAVNKVSARVA